MKIDAGKLRRLRMRRVLSMREMAQRSGVSVDALRLIERGTRQPHPSTIRKLAMGLDVAPEELILWDDSGETGSASEGDKGNVV